MEIPDEKLGYQTYEFTSSPVYTKPKSFPFLFPNPLRIEGEDDATNFMVVEVSEVSEVGGGMRMLATSYTVGGRVLFSGEYTVNKSDND